MKKRIAYIGLSYPLLYDYRNYATPTKNDLSDSPNPIIESPLGLMILYDELWFLCESLCPNNMRGLSYVKFVDKMFEDLYYEEADSFIENVSIKRDEHKALSYDDILNMMNLNGDRRYILDNHSHSIKIGPVARSANCTDANLAFDIYIFMALQERSENNLELLSNSLYCMNKFNSSIKNANVTERILIPNIPNYLSTDGPYHPCIEELRNNQYLKDYRTWINKNHNIIQNNEINDICTDVQQNIEETKIRIFNKYLEENSKYSFFSSSSISIIKLIGGIFSNSFSAISTVGEIETKRMNAIQASPYRWQGFVMNSQRIIEDNGINFTP